jgi:HAMP domain-containing protein
MGTINIPNLNNSERVLSAEIGRLSGRLREQAQRLQKQDQQIAAFGSSYTG